MDTGGVVMESDRDDVITASLASLHPDCLWTIFSWLNLRECVAIQRVNRTWQAVTDRMIGVSQDLVLVSNTQKIQSLNSSPKSGFHSSEINAFLKSGILSEEVMFLLAKHGIARKLVIQPDGDAGKLDGQALLLIFQYLPGLKSLKLIRCRLGAINDDKCMQLYDLANLSTLHLEDVSGDFRFLPGLLKSSKSLKELKLDCSNLQTELVGSILKSIPLSIERLILLSVSVNYLLETVPGLPNLVFLHVWDAESRFLAADYLIKLVKFNSLRVIKFEFCHPARIQTQSRKLQKYKVCKAVLRPVRKMTLKNVAMPLGVLEEITKRTPSLSSLSLCAVTLDCNLNAGMQLAFRLVTRKFVDSISGLPELTRLTLVDLKGLRTELATLLAQKIADGKFTKLRRLYLNQFNNLSFFTQLEATELFEAFLKQAKSKPKDRFLFGPPWLVPESCLNNSQLNLCNFYFFDLPDVLDESSAVIAKPNVPA